MIKLIKTERSTTNFLHPFLAVMVLFLVFITCNSGFAYENASSCKRCHGDFDDSTSPKGTVFPSGDKHRMHNNSSYMDTACELCHTEEEDDPFLKSSAGTANTPGLGCAGCHVGAGLRAHHVANSVDCNKGCHSPETPAPEGVNPPYYGSVDTKANNASNDVMASKTGENWSVGDFLGLDNDGDNLYDLADFDCGPAYQIEALAIEGGNVRITWDSVGGRRDMLQSAASLSASFSDVGSALVIPGVGVVSTNAVELSGVTASNRFYRIRYAPAP
jgi:hypothetical protein